jgi:hypothetical protein
MKKSRSLRFPLLILFVFLAAWSCSAQTKDEKKAEAQLRIVHGIVQDKDEDPIPSSVVYLLNVKSQAVKTSFTDEKGLYRFSGLDPNVDYEVHAEHGDMTSSTRTISSFDSRRDIEVNLKVNKKKKS